MDKIDYLKRGYEQKKDEEGLNYKIVYVLYYFLTLTPLFGLYKLYL